MKYQELLWLAAIEHDHGIVDTFFTIVLIKQHECLNVHSGSHVTPHDFIIETKIIILLSK